MKLYHIDYKGPCIYGIWSKSDPLKFYIGKTVQYFVRANRHKNDFKANRHGNPYLQRVFNLRNDLVISIFEICSIEKLDSKEILWISAMSTSDRNYGYNLTKGGKSVPSDLLIWSDDRKEAQSKRCSENPIATGFPKSNVWKKNKSKAMKERAKQGLHNVKTIPCIVTDINTGIASEYGTIKEVASIVGILGRTLYYRLKKNKTTKFKQYLIEAA